MKIRVRFSPSQLLHKFVLVFFLIEFGFTKICWKRFNGRTLHMKCIMVGQYTYLKSTMEAWTGLSLDLNYAVEGVYLNLKWTMDMDLDFSKKQWFGAMYELIRLISIVLKPIKINFSDDGKESLHVFSCQTKKLDIQINIISLTPTVALSQHL